MRELTLDPGTWQFIANQLSQPFEEYEVKFRAGGKGSSLVYADARVYQDRLDQVVGAQNWYVTHTPVELTDLDQIDVTKEKAPDSEKWPNGNYKKPVFDYEERHYGGIQTTLFIFGVSKEDVGKASKSEQLKGAYSDGLKRAATLWGVGKYFYSLGTSHSSTNTFPEEALRPAVPDYHGIVTKLQDQLKGNPEAKELLKGYAPGIPFVYYRQLIMDLREILNG